MTAMSAAAEPATIDPKKVEQLYKETNKKLCDLLIRIALTNLRTLSRLQEAGIDLPRQEFPTIPESCGLPKL